MFRIIDNKDPKLCAAYRCKNKRYRKFRLCPKHRRRKEKIQNPARYSYDALRGNAKRRKKEFKLTFEEFKQFCTKTNYLELKGKSGKSASIDRIDNTKGYELENIQVLTLRENTQKRNTEDYPF